MLRRMKVVDCLEEYEDDAVVIARNTSVLVARLPVFVNPKGGGGAQRYLTAAQPLAQRQAPRPIYTKPVGQKPGGAGTSDQDGISLMFKQQAEQWQQTQDQMAAAKPIHRQPIRPGNSKYRPVEMMEPQRPPPPGYTCFRCGEKGHYINMCPTIGDANFDNKPKIKRATGIPTMFLKTIQNKDAIDRGLMVTGEGDLVVAMPNDNVWQKMHALNKNFGAVGDAYDTAPILTELSCYICRKLLRDAVTSPCCSENFCDECIQKHLLDSDDVTQRLKCPKCKAKLIPDKLIVNNELRDRVTNHLRKYARSKRGLEEDESNQANKRQKEDF